MGGLRPPHDEQNREAQGEGLQVRGAPRPIDTVRNACCNVCNACVTLLPEHALHAETLAFQAKHPPLKGLVTLVTLVFQKVSRA